MTYFEKLKEVVLTNSFATTYSEATTEWVTTYYDYDEHETECLCGKCGLKHRYEITNVKTGNVLYPIGSECIEKFNNDKMTKDALTLKDVAEYRNSFLSFRKMDLSEINPNVVNYCYGIDALEDENDFEFMMAFSRKRSFRNISEKQKKKAYYLMETMENAVIFDPAFYNSERELEKEKKLRKEFVRENVGKYIKTETIPALVIIHLPEGIFDNPDQKNFVISMYRKIKRREQVNITEKQKKFFNMLIVTKILPYLKESVQNE